MCKVRLGKAMEVEKYCLLSEDIFSVQGGRLDAEHFIFSLKALQ